MKPRYSSASVQLRQDLARLLRRLRAVHRQKRPYDQLLWSIDRALSQARRLAPLVSFHDVPGAANPLYPSACPLSGQEPRGENQAAARDVAADVA